MFVLNSLPHTYIYIYLIFTYVYLYIWVIKMPGMHHASPPTVPTGRGSAPRPLAAAGGSAAAARPGQIFFQGSNVYNVCMYVCVN